MDTKVIHIKVDHNLEATTKSTNQLTNSLKGATNATTELGGKSDGLGKLQGGIDAVGNAVSGLNPAFGAAIKGSNGLILKMWEMVANPIGAILAAIVVTLKFLYEAFQSSVAGGKELKAVFASVSAVGAQVKDAVFGLARALIDVATAAYKFITLDFKGAAESMKKANQEATNSYKQLGNAVDGTTAKIIYNLEKQQQANDKARKIQAVVQSETNKLLVQSREILTDETASINEKKKALEEVTKAEKASSKEKTRIAAEDLRILKDRAAAMGGEAEKKMKGEIRDATIALNEAETENAMTGIKLNKQKKMLLRQETSDQKEAIDAQKAKDKELSDAKKKELEDRAKNIADHKKAIQDLEKKEYTIYSDMDGVLVDFNERFKRFSKGIPPTEYEQKFGKDKFWELVDGIGVRFWVGMDWMSDGKQLWDYIKSYNPTLLSSPSRADHSKMGKRIWRQRNLPTTKLVLSQARNKKNYANPDSILIDDRESNIDQWIKAGGVGILHTDTASTINKLKELGL